MAEPTLEDWVADSNLQEVNVQDIGRPVYRKLIERFIPPSPALDHQVGLSIRGARENRKLPRSKVASLLNLSDQFYERYETGASQLTVGGFIRICEVLPAPPEELLASAAPQLWGKTNEQSALLRANINKMRDLDAETLSLVYNIISKLCVPSEQ